MLNHDFEQLVTDYLSPNGQTRLNAEKQLNALLMRGDPKDLDLLYNSLGNNEFNNDVKLFIALLIKKIFDTCINEGNKQLYRSYIHYRKGDIVNTLLNLNSELKVINLLVISLCKAIDLFYDNKDDKETIIGSENDLTQLFSFPEVFGYIFAFYNKQKQLPNNNHQLTFQSLFISFTLLKHIRKENIQIDVYITSSFKDFYNQIIADFNTLTVSFCNSFQLQSSSLTTYAFEVNMQYLCLYLKLSKYLLNFLSKDQRESVMNITFTLLTALLELLLKESSASQLTHSKFAFDCLFLSNRILIKYTAHAAKIDLITIKKYAELFYIYISNRAAFVSICNLIKTSSDSSGYSIASDPEHKLSKFITDIIDFFRELLQLISMSNWGELIIFKDCYSDECIKISDYLSQHFFTDDKLRELLVFSIQNCLTFKMQEITMALSDAEEFYSWYDTLSPMVDLREKAGILCRIIYERYRKNLRDFISSLEAELIKLLQKEMTMIQSNETAVNEASVKCLSYEETNLKCSLLSFFETIAVYFFNKKVDYDKWINTIMLSQLSIGVINAKGSEVFSKFIIVRLLTAIIEYKEVEPYKMSIFTLITELFLKLSSEGMKKLLSLASIDFFYAFFDDIMPVDFPPNFFQGYIYKVCELLRNTSNPDIHSKTIKSTQAIINQCGEEEINASFSLIFPILKYLWDNNWNEYLKQTQSKKGGEGKGPGCNEIDRVRLNLIQLISIFVKRVGLFVTINNSKSGGESMSSVNGEVNKDYFHFIYNLIGFSINVKSNEASLLLSEGFRLILFIQDEYFDSSVMKANPCFKELKTPLESGSFFPSYLKMYDYLPLLFDNLFNSNDYIIIQLFIIEQLLSLVSVEVIAAIFVQFQFIDKIVFILAKIRGSLLNDYHQIIFNFMEYLLYVINAYPKLPTEQINQFNNFIYQFIADTFNQIEDCAIASIKHIDEEPLIDHPHLSIYIGAIQLANRLLFLNKRKGVISIDYSLLIAQKVSVVLLNKDLAEIMSCVQGDIIEKAIANINDILISNKAEFSLRCSRDTALAAFIYNEHNARSKAHYLNKHDRILSSRLYFFNKMNNQSYYYNLSAAEDKMRLLWSSKLEKMAIGDISNIEFKIKYYFLLNDDINATE